MAEFFIYEFDNIVFLNIRPCSAVWLHELKSIRFFFLIFFRAKQGTTTGAYFGVSGSKFGANTKYGGGLKGSSLHGAGVKGSTPKGTGFYRKPTHVKFAT